MHIIAFQCSLTKGAASLLHTLIQSSIQWGGGGVGGGGVGKGGSFPPNLPASPPMLHAAVIKKESFKLIAPHNL